MIGIVSSLLAEPDIDDETKAIIAAIADQEIDSMRRGTFFRHELCVSSEVLLSNIIPFAGSGLVGYAIGFALKKILKWILIIVGFLAGTFFLGIQPLQKYGYVSTVNWDKFGNDTSVQIQHWATNADTTNLHGLFHTIGIPISSGLGLGLLAGLVRTR